MTVRGGSPPRRAAGVAGLLVVLLLAGCGLPLPAGVQAPGPVSPQEPRAGDIAVLPPGPGPEDSEREIVEGFLQAQSSAADGHAVARQFLAPGVEWAADGAGVDVYDAAIPPDLQLVPGDGVVRVVSQQVAEVGADGAYDRATGEMVDEYEVACPEGRCRITGLPPGYGLRLTPTDLRLSYAPHAVHFLAPLVDGPSGRAHLAPDLVWLPRGPELAERLVRALVDGPSSALGRSVTTSVPDGTEVRGVRTEVDGTVTVDLSEQVAAMPEDARRQLSAQLVWTLRELGSGFSRLRLLSAGRPVSVNGSTRPQPAGAYPEFDPAWVRPRGTVLHLQDRRLAALAGRLPPSPATNGGLPVDGAAASRDGPLALLTRVAEGEVELRTGPRTGPFEPVLLRGRLSSPTWGSGERGLWLLQDGEVVLLSADGERSVVPVQDRERFGPLHRVQVSRDGVRVALLAGDPERKLLLVGRLVREDGRLRIVGLRVLAPDLAGVTDIAWESATSLVVLASFAGLGGPGRVAVDGSSTALLAARLPLEVVPVSVTAAPGEPVVLGGLREDTPYLYREDGGVFRQVAPGHSPFYPG